MHQTNWFSYQKHLSLILDTQLNIEKHLKTVFAKVTKTVGLNRRLRASLPIPSLLTFYKFLIRSHLDYGNIYDHTIIRMSYNNSF